MHNVLSNRLTFVLYIVDCFEIGAYLQDSQIGSTIQNITDAVSCQQKCQENLECQFWFHNTDTNKCRLLRENDKNSNDQASCTTCSRGPKICPQDWINDVNKCGIGKFSDFILFI